MYLSFAEFVILIMFLKEWLKEWLKDDDDFDESEYDASGFINND